MSQKETRTVEFTCYRCNVTSEHPNGSWGSVSAQKGSGAALLGVAYKADLCGDCCTSLSAWFADSPQQEQPSNTRWALRRSIAESILRPNPLFEAAKAGRLPKTTRVRRLRICLRRWCWCAVDAWSVLIGKSTAVEQ